MKETATSTVLCSFFYLGLIPIFAKISVGVSVGSADGTAVGIAVGVAVGRTVGRGVGICVGPLVGFELGTGVGTAVGLAVGDHRLQDCEPGSPQHEYVTKFREDKAPLTALRTKGPFIFRYGMHRPCESREAVVLKNDLDLQFALL